MARMMPTMTISPWKGLLCVLAAAGLIAACAETKLVVETAKQAEPMPENPEQGGIYKIGKPYEVEGVWYYPKVEYDYDETGIASWYGPGFEGKKTANGEIFDPNALTGAHKTLPMPSMVRVTNLENGRSIMLRINDRGPFAHNRLLDVSRRAAQLLGFEKQGKTKVRVQVLSEESQIAAARAGAGNSGETGVPPPSAAPAGDVAASGLPPIAGAPVAPAAQSAEALPPLDSGSAIGTAEMPMPEETIIPVPVKPTQIYIQAGAFLSRANADKLAAALTSFGPSRITTFMLNQQRFYRVQVGPMASVEEADRVLDDIIASGQRDAKIVVN